MDKERDIFAVEEINSSMKLQRTCLIKIDTNSHLFLAPASLASLSLVRSNGTTTYTGTWTALGRVVFVDVGKIMGDDSLFQLCCKDGIQLYRCMNDTQKRRIVLAFNTTTDTTTTLNDTADQYTTKAYNQSLATTTPDDIQYPTSAYSESESAISYSQHTSPPKKIKVNTNAIQSPFDSIQEESLTLKQTYTDLQQSCSVKMDTYSQHAPLNKSRMDVMSHSIEDIEKRIQRLTSMKQKGQSILDQSVDSPRITPPAFTEAERELTRMETSFDDLNGKLAKETEKLETRIKECQQSKLRVFNGIGGRIEYKIVLGVLLVVFICHYITLIVVK